MLLVGVGHGVLKFWLQKKFNGHVPQTVSEVELHCDMAYIPSLHVEHTAHVRASCCVAHADVNKMRRIVFFIFLKCITVKIVFLSISFFGDGWAILKFARGKKRMGFNFWIWETLPCVQMF